MVAAINKWVRVVVLDSLLVNIVQWCGCVVLLLVRGGGGDGDGGEMRVRTRYMEG